MGGRKSFRGFWWVVVWSIWVSFLNDRGGRYVLCFWGEDEEVDFLGVFEEFLVSYTCRSLWVGFSVSIWFLLI